jgi:hypothetical protein
MPFSNSYTVSQQEEYVITARCFIFVRVVIGTIVLAPLALKGN